nr:MAG TPA: hypothetical protein [Caudoviricetes sp.]
MILRYCSRTTSFLWCVFHTKKSCLSVLLFCYIFN